MKALLLLLGVATVFAQAPCEIFAPMNYSVLFTTTKGNFTVNVDANWGINSANRFWSALECGHYTKDEFIWVQAGKAVQWGLSGNTTDDSIWMANTFPSDIPQNNNTYGWVSFVQNGTDTASVILAINLGTNPDYDAAGFAPFGFINSADMKVVSSFYAGYGMTPDEDDILTEGTPYLTTNFPLLDSNLAVTAEVTCPVGERYCNYITGDQFAVECCTVGESCIPNAGCRCMTDNC
jgi:cyclophilin family peptidyl-prolyl cis-trans isomerase